MADPSSFEELRFLGRLERHASARHSLGFYNNVATSAYYSNGLYKNSLEALVYKAISIVIKRHPVLSAIVVGEDANNPKFVRLPKIDLADAIQFLTRKHAHDDGTDSQDQELDEVLQAQHNKNFQDDLGRVPLWRLVILKSKDNIDHFAASFVHHHAIGDGNSGMAFHRSFQTALSDVTERQHELVEPEPPSTIVEPSKDDLLPPVEAMLDLSLSFSFVAKALWNDWFPKTTPGLWNGSLITDSPSKRKTCFRSFSLSEQNTTKLRVAAREHSSSLTAVAETLLAAVLFTRLPEQYSIVQCNGPISMRRYFQSYIVDKNSMGHFVSRYMETHHRPQVSDIKEDDFTAVQLFSWQEAQRVRSTITTELNKEGRDAAVGLLKYVNDLHKFFQAKVGKPREVSFEFSNVGVFQSDDTTIPDNDKRWKIGRVVFSQCADVVGAPLNCSVVTGGDGRLTMAFTWLDGMIEDFKVEEVIEDFEHALQELVPNA